jgi:hypothetical protein
MEHSRIRLASIYIYPLKILHTCTFWFDYMTFFSLNPLFDFTIYALQVCSLALSLPINFTKALGSKNTTYVERLDSIIQRNL